MEHFKHAAGRRWIGLAVLAVAAFAMQSLTATDAPSDQDCKDAWTSSSASNSCGTSYYQNGVILVNTNSYYVVAYSGECQVAVDCRQANTYHQPISIRLSAQLTKSSH